MTASRQRARERGILPASCARASPSAVGCRPPISSSASSSPRSSATNPAWVAEGHGGDQFAILGACAVATRRILLGTAISSVFVRSAPTIGMAAATVDHLSRGRFILGLGSSHRVQVEPEHGIPFVQPTARLRDTIGIVRALLARRRRLLPRRDGDDRAVRPVVPAAPADIPLYVAALFPRMLEIAGELSQGVLLTVAHARRPSPGRRAPGNRRPPGRPRAVRGGRGLADSVRGGRHAPPRRAISCGRRLASTPGSFRATTGCSPRRASATRCTRSRRPTIAAAREAAAKVVPDELIDAVALAGTPDTCRERLAAYRRAGLALPIVSPRVSGADAKKTAMAAIRACAAVSHPIQPGIIQPVRAAPWLFLARGSNLAISQGS